MNKPFDLLHAMWADETGLIAGWAGRRLGIPVVVSILGGELVGLRDIGYGLQRSRFSRWIVGQALSGADRVIVPSSYVRRLAAGSFRPRQRRSFRSRSASIPVRFTPPDRAARSLPPDSRRLARPGQGSGSRCCAPSPCWISVRRSTLSAKVSERAGSKRWRANSVHERVRFLGAVAHPDLPRSLPAGRAQSALVAPRNHRHDHARSRRLRRSDRQHECRHRAGLSVAGRECPGR